MPPAPAICASQSSQKDRQRADLINQIDALLDKHARPQSACIPLEIAPIDAALQGGLTRDAIHEWIGTCDAAGTPPRSAPWSPPLTMLTWVAHKCGDSRGIIWIGERVWPYAPSLCSPAESRIALDRCLFVRPRTPSDRLWAADTALRSAAAGAVIVDAAKFDLAATRRLQLAAEAGATPCLLARPPCEQSVLSAASTRWRISRAVSHTTGGRWSVRLLRCKGVRTTNLTDTEWILERDHATSALRVAADIRHGSRDARPLYHRTRHAG